jgi:hypothetical protein
MRGMAGVGVAEGKGKFSLKIFSTCVTSLSKNITTNASP